MTFNNTVKYLALLDDPDWPNSLTRRSSVAPINGWARILTSHNIKVKSRLDVNVIFDGSLDIPISSVCLVFFSITFP